MNITQLTPTDQFREAVRAYVERPGNNAHRLAQASGVHFTSIYRFLEGRTLASKSVDKLLPIINSDTSARV